MFPPQKNHLAGQERDPFPAESSEGADAPASESAIIAALAEAVGGHIAPLEAVVDQCYRAASRRLLAVLNGRLRFREHLRGLRAFMLLGQGDFVRHLMDLLKFVDPPLRDDSFASQRLTACRAGTIFSIPLRARS